MRETTALPYKAQPVKDRAFRRLGVIQSEEAEVGETPNATAEDEAM